MIYSSNYLCECCASLDRKVQKEKLSSFHFAFFNDKKCILNFPLLMVNWDSKLAHDDMV